jgi:uncharacterized damage-inducible protein DinB
MIRDRLNLLQQLRSYSWNEEGWFVPLAEALKDLSVTQAAWQPPGGGNTIWQTVNHLNFYNYRILCRLTGQPLDAQKESNDETFGGPSDAANTAAWEATVQEAGRIADGLKKALAELTEADLDRSLSEASKAPAADFLAAWIMHDAYHTGQIVLLRKQQGSWPATR